MNTSSVLMPHACEMSTAIISSKFDIFGYFFVSQILRLLKSITLYEESLHFNPELRNASTLFDSALFQNLLLMLTVAQNLNLYYFLSVVSWTNRVNNYKSLQFLKLGNQL